MIRSALCALSPVLAGAAVLSALGCGSQSLGGSNPPPTGVGGRGGVAGGKGGVIGGAGGTAGAGGDAGGTAGAVSGEGGAAGGGGATGAGGFVGPINRNVDILFMVDNSSEMTAMQKKLYNQIPSFLSLLQSQASPPSLHIAVVSSDMGAPGDATSSIGCTAMGDQGQFQSMPRGTCTSTTLAAGATFISDADMMPNYTDPNISDVLQCIMLLGDRGCGFEHQLASIDRALGADGSGAPSTNLGFLRPDAYLAIIILTNEDDCSAPANTKLYSLNGGEQNITNPLGPVANYRCNQFGHLCTDPATGVVGAPPLVFPSDAQGTTTAPTLDLVNCMSNDTTGLLTPVAQFVSDIRALKYDPDNQIFVGAVIGPPAPYTVEWVPALNGQNSPPGELWPQMEHSCGAAGSVNPEATSLASDGSFGDPGVRIAQFASSFPKSHLGSICDASYMSVVGAVFGDIAQALSGQ